MGEGGGGTAPHNLRLCSDLPNESLKDRHFCTANDLALMAVSYVFTNIFPPPPPQKK